MKCEWIPNQVFGKVRKYAHCSCFSLKFLVISQSGTESRSSVSSRLKIYDFVLFSGTFRCKFNSLEERSDLGEFLGWTSTRADHLKCWGNCESVGNPLLWGAKCSEYLNSLVSSWDIHTSGSVSDWWLRWLQYDGSDMIRENENMMKFTIIILPARFK